MQPIAKTLCTWVLCLLVLSVSLSAQEGTIAQDPSVPTATKSPVLAGVLESMVPWVGFAYAGDAGRGTVPNLVRVGGVVLLFAGLDFDEGEWFWLVPLSDEALECTTVCRAGFVVALAGTVWAVAGAVDTANDRNALVQAARSLSVGPSPSGGVSVGLRVRVP